MLYALKVYKDKFPVMTQRKPLYGPSQTKLYKLIRSRLKLKVKHDPGYRQIS